MRTLPIELLVEDRLALVVGSGGEVESKIDRLIEAGARVLVIAERPSEAIEERARRGAIRLERRAARVEDAEGAALVFVSPDETELAKELHARALASNTLVGTIDRPERSTFTSSAIVRVSGLVMTFSSGGASPGALRRIREDLTELFGEERFGRFLARLHDMRERLPRGERARLLADAVRGFRIEARLAFPPWFEAEERDATNDVSREDPPGDEGGGANRG